jgi:hypothetical protein|tara:strand:- start:2028 stop:2540 length:513 start_codon:yes stop_codon:yes gene_type:complete
MRECSSNITPPEPRIVRDTIIEYVTIEKELPVYVPQIKYITKVDIDTFQLPIDTAEILEDYYAVKTYEDKQVLDSLDITITDTISRNQILGRHLKYNFTYPRKTIINTVYVNKRELYIGASITGRLDQLNIVGTELLYKDKKQHAYGFGVGINQFFLPTYTFRMYWKLGK